MTGDEAVALIGNRWIDWMGPPPRAITNHLGAAMEAVDALLSDPDLLARLAIDSGGMEPEWTGGEWLFRRTFKSAAS